MFLYEDDYALCEAYTAQSEAHSVLCEANFALCEANFALCEANFALCEANFALCEANFALCEANFALCEANFVLREANSSFLAQAKAQEEAEKEQYRKFLGQFTAENFLKKVTFYCSGDSLPIICYLITEPNSTNSSNFLHVQN